MLWTITLVGKLWRTRADPSLSGAPHAKKTGEESWEGTRDRSLGRGLGTPSPENFNLGKD